MSFSRNTIPTEFPRGEILTACLIGIGFRLHGELTSNPNIEDVLIAASLEGMHGDLRVLSLLVDWIDIHHERILTDRLYRLVSAMGDKRLKAFWAAVAKWKKKDRRFKRLQRIHRGSQIDLLETGTEFHVLRHGEDSRFEGTALRVPKQAGLRHRPSDIIKPHELAKIHRTYYYRLLIGPTYRADMWAQLDLNPDLSPSELARRCYGSFATAWQVKQEWAVVRQAA